MEDEPSATNPTEISAPAPTEVAAIPAATDDGITAAAAKLEAALQKRDRKPEEVASQPVKTEHVKTEQRDRPPRGDNRGPREGRGATQSGGPPNRENAGRENAGRERGGKEQGARGDRREGRPGGFRPFEGSAEIELEKLMADSLYLDNQAHAVVARLHDLDSGTKSQLRRLYGAVRRAVRASDAERQHEFVMLRARLAYTIARHSLRSLDGLERLLLQVTRRNDIRGYERFKDLFEAIVAYNE